MRLLKTTTLQLEEFPPDRIPPYAILSHTWGADEVLFEDIRSNTADTKATWTKVKEICRLSLERGLEYVWIDNCCIDKSSSAEISETINSMFMHYEEAAVCLAYLADVPFGHALEEPGSPLDQSRWFTRGFTLQELIAPSEIIFLSQDWHEIGTKHSLRKALFRITRIDDDILMNQKSLECVSVARRMSWAAHRRTTRPEDIAYCLMGIFSVNMPMLYGEGSTKAFLRLQEEIMKHSDDQSIFAWVKTDASPSSLHGLMATSPANFAGCSDIIPYQDWVPREPYSMTNRGLQIALPLTPTKGGLYVALLDCPSPPHYTGFLGIFLKRLSEVDEQYARVKIGILAQVQDPGPTSTIYVRQTIKSDIAGLYPRHCIQLRSLPPIGGPYELTNIAAMQGKKELAPAPILSTRDNHTIAVSRFPKTFILDKTANSLCAGVVFKSPEDTMVYVLLGSDANFGVGFNVVEEDSGMDNPCYPQYQPLAPGAWVTLKHSMVHVTAEPRVHNSTKYFMVDIEIQAIETSNNPLQVLSDMFSYPPLEGPVRIVDESDRPQPAMSKYNWRRMIHSTKSVKELA
ncbi:hypothetical protein N7513_012055 [Penicillium frequentans]|nr:hypothetical protein N7513_012055 [Penicillium glabrum]